jgi:hypothetical protein
MRLLEHGTSRNLSQIKQSTLSHLISCRITVVCVLLSHLGLQNSSFLLGASTKIFVSIVTSVSVLHLQTVSFYFP